MFLVLFLQRLRICFLSPLAVSPQTVTVVSLTPQPTCPNQELVYSCEMNFPSLTIRWKLPRSEILGFIAVEDAVGTKMNTSDGRVVANLTMNEGAESYRILASTLTIYPPLNDLNGTNLNLTCEGFELEVGTRSDVVSIDLTGEFQRTKSC